MICNLFDIALPPMFYLSLYFRQIAKSTVLDVFAGPPHSGVYSPSVQNTCYIAEKLILDKVPQVSWYPRDVMAEGEGRGKGEWKVYIHYQYRTKHLLYSRETNIGRSTSGEWEDLEIQGRRGKEAQGGGGAYSPSAQNTCYIGEKLI